MLNKNMCSLKKVSGKIINHNEIFFGSISFDNKFQKIDKVKNSNINQYIIPGFVDLHCHGAINNDTMQGFKSIKKMSEFHLSKGTTSLLPTTLTNKFEDTYKALEGFNEFILHEDNNIEGVHLEGPFINPNKLGAQPPLTQTPNIDFIKTIQKIAKVRTVTLAPEIEGAENLIKYLFENFPEFVQGETRLAVFGPTTVKSVKDHHLRVDIEVPNKKAPSMSMALEQYIKEANKRRR